jgi:hypothetical protein
MEESEKSRPAEKLTPAMRRKKSPSEAKTVAFILLIALAGIAMLARKGQQADQSLTPTSSATAQPATFLPASPPTVLKRILNTPGGAP